MSSSHLLWCTIMVIQAHASIPWHTLEEHLFEQISMIIKQFAEEHPESDCSFFASETDLSDGIFSGCLENIAEEN